MRAVTWQGVERVSVEQVPDPRIEQPTDAIIRVTSSAICGSDLHLYKLFGMFMNAGDIIGHEPMGIVEEVGSGVSGIAPGDRVVVPFNISCGHCFMCAQQLYAQCETTQVTEHGKGAALFGYTKLYGAVPGGQAEYLRVPQAQFGPIKVPEEHPDERFLFLSDILPTAAQAVAYAGIREARANPGSVAVLGLGPVGQFCARLARHRGARVIGVDLVPERLAMARRHDVEVIDLSAVDNVAACLRELTHGRGPDAVIDAVGLEAHGSPLAAMAQRVTTLLPDPVAAAAAERFGVDRLVALRTAIDAVRRGGTVSIVGVYAGAKDPLPMLDLFDKGIQLRMGQAHVKRWVPELLPLVTGDDDPLGTQDLTTHRLPLDAAPEAYEMFQNKRDGCVKVVLTP